MQYDPTEMAIMSKLYEAMDCWKAAAPLLGAKCRVDKRHSTIKHSEGTTQSIVAKLVDNRIVWLPPLQKLDPTLTTALMRENFGL